MLVSERKLKKYYLSFPAFTYALSELHIQIPEGILMEHLFVSIFDAKFFYRSTTKEEVDIVQTEPEVMPIEIKYKPQILPKDIRGIRSFIRKYKPKQGMIISKDEEREIEINGMVIKIVPYWKVLIGQYYEKTI
jgi:predicted AAA+ superfamily ATPase